MFILECILDIKFAWSALPGRKYDPKGEFLSVLETVPAVL